MNELDRAGQLLVIYNLHLESRTNEDGRLLQLEEFLRDAVRYPASTPVIIAGDLNTGRTFSSKIRIGFSYAARWRARALKCTEFPRN